MEKSTTFWERNGGKIKIAAVFGCLALAAVGTGLGLEILNSANTPPLEPQVACDPMVQIPELCS